MSKSNINLRFNFLCIIILFAINISAFAYQECDTLRTCIGRDLEFSITSGKGAHYIDIDKTKELNKISTQMTVEFWCIKYQNKPVKFNI